jgi:SAM-dependent methyltransferase
VARIRESGIPDQALWESFFDPPAVLAAFCGGALEGDVLEFGCGYGTFAVPAAQLAAGTVYALDIDAAMVAATAQRAARAGLTNLITEERDFLASGSGRSARSVQLALLLNILHLEDPVALLEEARRILRPDGTVAVMHWKRDAGTPRGPPLAMRPRPEDCREWAKQAGFVRADPRELPGAPWHWGLALSLR